MAGPRTPGTPPTPPGAPATPPAAPAAPSAAPAGSPGSPATPPASPAAPATPSASGPSVGGGGATPANPQQSQQQKQRDEELERQKRINFAMTYYYKHWPKFVLADEVEKEKVEMQFSGQKMKACGLSAGNQFGGLLKGGLYRDVTRNRGFDVLVEPIDKNDESKGFTAKPVPPPTSSSDFKKGYGIVMDGLAAGRGASTLKVSFDSLHTPNEIYLAYRDMHRLIRMAEKRGLMVEVPQELYAKLPQKRANKLRQRMIKLGVNQQRISLLEGTPNLEIKEQKDKLDKQVKMGTDDDYKKQLFGTGAAEKQGDARMQAIDDEMKVLAQRQKDLEDARNALAIYTDAMGKGLDDPNLMDLIQKKRIPATGFLGQLLQQISEGRASREKARFKDAETVLEGLNKRAEDSKPERDALIAAIKVEEDDLAKRQKVLDAEAKKLQAVADPKAVAADADYKVAKKAVDDLEVKIQALMKPTPPIPPGGPALPAGVPAPPAFMPPLPSDPNHAAYVALLKDKKQADANLAAASGVKNKADDDKKKADDVGKKVDDFGKDGAKQKADGDVKLDKADKDLQARMKAANDLLAQKRKASGPVI